MSLFLLGVGLHFFESIWYQIQVSPDYFFLFLTILVPTYCLATTTGVWAASRENVLLNLVAPAILTFGIILKTGELSGAARPPGWPTPLPIAIYVLITIALLIVIGKSFHDRQREAE